MSSLAYLVIPLALAALVGWLRSLQLAQPLKGADGALLRRPAAPTRLPARAHPAGRPAATAGEPPRHAA